MGSDGVNGCLMKLERLEDGRLLRVEYVSEKNLLTVQLVEVNPEELR